MDRECKTSAISTYYDNVKRCIVNFESEVEKFGKLNSNLERIRWINQLTELNALDEKFLPVQQQYPGKAETIASAGKEQGNEAFKAKKWSEALKYYSASYISIPSQNGKQQQMSSTPFNISFKIPICIKSNMKYE